MPLFFSYIRNFKKPIPYYVAMELSRGRYKDFFQCTRIHSNPIYTWCPDAARYELFLEKHATCGHTIVFMSNLSRYIWNGLFKALLGPSPPLAMQFLWSNFFQLSNSQFAKGYLEFCLLINWAFVFKTSLLHSVLHPIQHPIYLQRLSQHPQQSRHLTKVNEWQNKSESTFNI